jgi:hypothetical protein
MPSMTHVAEELPRETSSSLLKSKRRRALSIATALLSLVAATPVEAQSADSATQPSPPVRIANHYNHKAYQPRAQDVCAAERSSGIDCDSQAGAQAQRELERIGRQLGSPKAPSDRAQ